MMKRFTLLLAILLTGMAFGQSPYWVTTTNNDGPGSLRAMLNSAPHGATIKFSPTLLSGGSDTIHLDTCLTRLSGMRLVGAYNNTDTIYIDGHDTIQILRIDLDNAPADQDIILDSLVFIRGSADSHPSQIFLATSFYEGGAVRYEGADSLVILNSVFRGCKAQVGDAVYCTELSSQQFRVVIDNSRFSHCTTLWDQGVVAIDDAKYLTVTNSIFNHNKNRPLIGAADNFLLQNSSFFRNGDSAASDIEGHVQVNQNGIGYYRIENTEFKYNFSESDGGALYVIAVDDPIIRNCTFIGNRTESSGGGFFLDAISTTPIGSGQIPAQVVGCSFRGNHADQSGGGMGTSQARVDSSIFIGNSALGGGGFFMSNPSRGFELNWCRINSNTVTNSGGGILSGHVGLKGTINYCTIGYNTAGSKGGGYAYGDGEVGIYNSTFHHNSANQGGGVYNDDYDLTLEHVSILDNQATSQGGGIYSRYGIASQVVTCTMANTAVVNNTPADMYREPNGGVFFTSNGHNLLGNDDGVFLAATDQVVSDTLFTQYTEEYGGPFYTAYVPDSLNAGLNAAESPDTTDPINGLRMGVRRDIGAAESFYLHQITALSPTVCDSIQLGNTWYSDTALVTFNFTNTSGQDSTVVYSLVDFQQSYFTLDSAKACTMYRWIDNQWYGKDTVVTTTIPSVHGCDSVVELHLDIVGIDKSITYNNGILTLGEQRPGATYQWIRCGNNTPYSWAADTAILHVQQNGAYKCIINYDGCTEVTDCYTVADFNVSEASLLPFRYYPNPTHGKLTIETQYSDEYTIQVIDINGRVLISKSAQGTQELELPEADGVYIVEVKSKDGVYRERIIRSR